MKPRTAALLLVLAVFGFKHLPWTDNKIRSSIVQLESPNGYCTGEQVRGKSGKVYILTAGHCVALGGKLTATTEDGVKHTIRFLYESQYADLALYTPVKGLTPFSVAGTPHAHDRVRIFSHGEHHATYTTAGELLEGNVGDIQLPEMPADGCTAPKYKATQGLWVSCALHTYTLTTTAWAVPGSSGGPAVDKYGNLLGVVSGGNDRFTFLVPTWTIAKFLRSF